MTIGEFYKFKEDLAWELSGLLSIRITDGDVMEALFVLHSDERDLEWVGDVWDLDITYDEALTKLLAFDFNIFSKTIQVDEDWIPSDFLFKRKARFKHKGTIWIIHRYDADPFPSLPHAHNIESNHKLDLSTGKCYEKREYKYSFSKKALLEIRKRASQVYAEELPELQI